MLSGARGLLLMHCTAAVMVALAGCERETAPRSSPAASGAEAKPVEIPARLARFMGTWERVDALVDPTRPRRETAPPLSLNAAYAERFKLLSAALKAGSPLDVHANCLPFGMPRIMTMPLPFEAVVTPSKIVIIPEDQSPPRMIWVDGRTHSADPDPSYNGHSVGRWEGDVLVVETIGLRTDTPINVEGLTMSKSHRIVERFSFEKDGVLRDEITSYDPEVLAEPWTVVRRYQRSDYEIQEMVCEENNRNPLSAEGLPQVLESLGK